MFYCVTTSHCCSKNQNRWLYGQIAVQFLSMMVLEGTLSTWMCLALNFLMSDLSMCTGHYKASLGVD